MKSKPKKKGGSGSIPNHIAKNGSQSGAVANAAKKLTAKEKADLMKDEKIIKQGFNTFFEVGRALSDIKEKRLYRDGFSTFEEYCRTKWQYDKSYAYRLIGAHDVLTTLSSIGDKQIRLPLNECQVRPLVSLAPEQRIEAWKVSFELTGHKDPTAEIVKRAAAKFHKSTKPAAEAGSTSSKKEEASKAAGIASDIVTTLQIAEQELGKLENVEVVMALVKAAKERAQALFDALVPGKDLPERSEPVDGKAIVGERAAQDTQTDAKREKITALALRRRYGPHYEEVLAEQIQGDETSEPRQFLLLKPLPTKKEYEGMLRTNFTRAIEEWLNEAFGIFEGLKEDYQNWLDNLPESLRESQKAEELQEAIDALDQFGYADRPGCDWVEWIKAFHLPASDQSSRPKLLAEATSNLEDCAKELRRLVTSGEYEKLKPPGIDEEDPADEQAGGIEENVLDPKQLEDAAASLEAIAGQAIDLPLPGMF